MKNLMQFLSIGMLFCLIPLNANAGYSGITTSGDMIIDQISLNERVENKRGARIHIQYGEVVSSKYRVYENEPYCYFQIHRPGSELRSPVDIQPATFQIRHVRNRSYQVQLVPENSRESFAGLPNGGPGGSAQQLTLATEFHLKDPAQPHVTKLTCAVYSDPRDRGHVTIEEMHKTLGSLVEIN